jgi:hypothetical protein
MGEGRRRRKEEENQKRNDRGREVNQAVAVLLVLLVKGKQG